MQDNINRLHYMDAMRAILMILGVVLHSAQVFNPTQSWIIYSENGHSFFNYLVDIISTFRMPAFFIVSGFFCFITLKKYKVRLFLSLRLKRIIIPFAFTAITLNTLQALLLEWSGWQQFEYPDYLLKGEFVSHLWFLTNLIVYFIVASFLISFFGPLMRLVGNRIVKMMNPLPITIVVAVMPLFSIIILSLNKVGLPLYSSFFSIFNVFSILQYAPFFIFGVVMGLSKDLLARLSSANPFLCLAVIVISFLLIEWMENTGNMKGWFSIMVVQYLTLLTIWFSVLICFFVFYRYFNKSSKIMFYLSDASYTVYLFHHIFVVLLGLLVVYLSFPAYLSVFILITCVTAITLYIHSHIILKYKLCLFMFNGK